MLGEVPELRFFLRGQIDALAFVPADVRLGRNGPREEQDPPRGLGPSDAGQDGEPARFEGLPGFGPIDDHEDVEIAPVVQESERGARLGIADEVRRGPVGALPVDHDRPRSREDLGRGGLAVKGEGQRRAEGGRQDQTSEERGRWHGVHYDSSTRPGFFDLARLVGRGLRRARESAKMRLFGGTI